MLVGPFASAQVYWTMLCPRAMLLFTWSFRSGGKSFHVGLCAPVCITCHQGLSGVTEDIADAWGLAARARLTRDCYGSPRYEKYLIFYI